MWRASLYILLGGFLVTRTGLCNEQPSIEYDTLLTKALAQSVDKTHRAGDFTRQLKQVLQQSNKPSQRTAAAYLLFLRPDLCAPLTEQQLVDIALESKDPAAIVGRQAYAHLLRSRADRYFYAGNFVEAGLDFGVLSTVSEGLAREYALLKQGWCLFNQNKPSEAFSFWLGIIENDITEPKASSSWFRALAQGLSENKDRTDKDVRRLSATLRTPDDTRSVIEGIVEGAKAIDTRQGIASLARVLAHESWYPKLVESISSEAKPQGSSACSSLPWFLAQSQDLVATEQLLSLLSSCNSFAGPKDLNIQQDLIALVRRLDLRGRARRLPFVIFNNNHIWGEACEHGLAWFSEVSPGQDFPATSVADACLSGHTDTAVQYAVALLDRLATDTTRLRGDRSVYLFVYASLARDSRFRNAIFQKLTKAPLRFHATDLPKILAQAAIDNLDLESTRALVDSAKEHHEFYKDPIWREIAVRLVEEISKLGKASDAFEALTQYFPVNTEQAPDTQTRAMWAQFINRYKEEERSMCADSVRQILEASQGFAKDYALLVDIALDVGVTDAAAKAIAKLKGWSHVSNALRGRVEDALFLLWIDRAPGYEPPAPVQLTVLYRLTAALRDRNFEQAIPTKNIFAGKLAKDLSIASLVSKRTRRLASFQDGFLEQVGRWVQGLKIELATIEKHGWLHQSLRELAQFSVKEFCKNSAAKLNRYSPETLEPGLKPIYQQVIPKLIECQAESRAL